MATLFKRLGAGNDIAANSTITAYTVPLSYKTIVKSFIITNSSASSVIIAVSMANIGILSNYVMKPNDTILVPVMDQLLIAGNSITVYSTTASAISYYISGIETLVTDPEYADVLRFGYGAIQVSSGTIVSANSSKDRLIKGIILCNTATTDRKVSMWIFGWSILQPFTIKANDTILIPTSDILIPAGEYVTASSSASGVNYYITGKEL
ncbi:hypothetical protein ACWIE6_29545 [Paenibacillus taichungensis]